MLGQQTVQVGSISKGAKRSNSTSYQMHGKPLMSEDEIKRMPKYNFVFNKTGMAPFKAKFRRYPYWGINLNEDKYEMNTNTLKEVHYATRDKLMNAIKEKYYNNIESDIPIQKNTTTNKKSLSEEFF